MKKVSLNGIINIIIFLYIVSLYVLTYRAGLHLISNALALGLIVSIWANFLVTRRKLVFNKFLFLFLLFIIICSISIFYALDPSLALTKVRTLLLIFLVMFSLVNHIDSYEKIEKFIKHIVYSGIIASLYILSTSDFSQLTRFGGELGNVNAIGMIIGISTTFCFYFIITEKKRTYIFFMVPMLSTILLTGSRKSLLFVVMNILLIVYLKNRGNLKSIFKFVVITMAIMLIFYFVTFNVPLFYQIVGVRLENMFNFILGHGTIEGSMNTRAFMIDVGVEMFKNKPLTGYGIDNFRILYGNIIGGIGTYSHNNFIELLVDVGIIGFITYYFTHTLILKSLFRSSKMVVNSTLCFTFIAIIISYTILGLSLVYYDSKHFSFLLAVASSIGKTLEKTSLPLTEVTIQS